jgi:hypothetical protein
MTPTALTPAGRGTRSKQRPTADRAHRAASVSDGARTAMSGARQAAQGVRTARSGARTAASGVRTAAGGARTAASGARTAAKGTRAMVDGARTMAEGARIAASSSARTAPASHRSTVRRSTAPRSPRRVSGPARPAAPRRTSGRRAARQPVVRAPLGHRCAAFVRSLPDHSLLDRMVRGRYWIPLLGILLAGIVAMQVEVLKLNAGVGRALERTTALQSHNEQLREAVARDADDQRIERRAAAMGMVMSQPSEVQFLAHQPTTDLAKAVANIHQPDATGFTAQLAAEAAKVAATGATASAGVTSATGTAATTGVVPTTPASGTTAP